MIFLLWFFHLVPARFLLFYLLPSWWQEENSVRSPADRIYTLGELPWCHKKLDCVAGGFLGFSLRFIIWISRQICFLVDVMLYLCLMEWILLYQIKPLNWHHFFFPNNLTFSFLIFCTIMIRNKCLIYAVILILQNSYETLFFIVDLHAVCYEIY